MTKQEAGRLGGLATFLRHGTDYMSANGKRGGRPKLQATIALGREEIKTGRELHAESLKNLKVLFRAKYLLPESNSEALRQKGGALCQY
jgi:hypothetical protein